MLNWIGISLRRMSFYAVARGKTVGIFKTWPECQQQTKGFSGAIFKKFKTQNEAQDFIDLNQTTQNARKVSAVSLSSSSNGSASSSRMVASVATKRSGKRALEIDAVSILPNEKKTKTNAEKTEEYTSNITGMTKYGDNYFLEDNDGYVHVYTDGSCENNGRANAIAGYGVYFNDGNPLNVSAPVVGPATNNRGEIQAVIKAIEIALQNEMKKLCINSDSQFVINAVNEWFPNWIKKGWKRSNGKKVENEHDFRKLHDLIQKNPQLKISWKYVAAHVGIHGNERADELAKNGSKFYKK